MKFRPCIDIHNGSVKQIVGGSLADENNYAKENFVCEYDGGYYGRLYKSKGLDGGHIIILNPSVSEYYQSDLKQAYAALSAFEGGLQIGGGINDENAAQFLDRGASHVIVTSFVFKNGDVNFDNLNRLVKAVGRQRLTLDLSCRKRGGDYYIVTDRWQRFTDIKLDKACINMFSGYCDELLIHAVDVEGKAGGIESGVAKLMGESCNIPCTYAGGISSFEDIQRLRDLGKARVDFTIGSALDIFGGKMSFEKVCEYSEKTSPK